MIPKAHFLNNFESQYLVLNKDDFIAKALAETGEWESHVSCIANLFCSRVQRPIVLDIGANIGAFSVPVGKSILESNGIIYAFEPQRIVNYNLCANVLLNQLDNVHIRHQAVGETCKNIEIPIPDYEKITNVGGYSITADGRAFTGVEHFLTGKFESIEMITLDSLELDSTVCFIKLDVEGYEENVILGGREFLKRNSYPPILFEAWHEESYRPQRESLLNLIEQLGYKIFAISETDHIAQHPSYTTQVAFRLEGRNFFAEIIE